MFLSQRGKTHNLPLSRITVITKNDAEMRLDSILDLWCGLPWRGVQDGLGFAASLLLGHQHNVWATYFSCHHFLRNILRKTYYISQDIH